MLCFSFSRLIFCWFGLDWSCSGSAITKIRFPESQLTPHQGHQHSCHGLILHMFYSLMRRWICLFHLLRIQLKCERSLLVCSAGPGWLGFHIWPFKWMPKALMPLTLKLSSLFLLFQLNTEFFGILVCSC